ncbi:hypothetical protein [Flavobacterium fluviale]|uniref:Uncharacterized protein n=1 Tax=Flavobacterium fluviale TaxID=2249356 RepID=A0A344LS08_9FLAO|nr:hypothetical protein [Flavobacterium fluviale]AXB56700.1 hypothetical protein HYN86_08835 [Flavobacterium fluviale]
MKISLNSNFIKSSNLIFISALLGIINLLLSPEIISSQKGLKTSIITILLILTLGVLIRYGVSWIKYILLILIILGLFNTPAVIKYMLIYNPINAIIIILQSLVQISATVLLFRNSIKE